MIRYSNCVVLYMELCCMHTSFETGNGIYCKSKDYSDVHVTTGTHIVYDDV